MALSVVNFKMHHGKDVDQITFSGNGIKLLDLKKEIIDKKAFARSLDYDLKIVDETGKAYVEDDEVVPKNATIVVKRMPSKNSVVARLNSRGMQQHHQGGAANRGGSEIVMPMKMEVEDTPAVAPAAPVPVPVPPAAPSQPPSAPAAIPAFAPNHAAGVPPVPVPTPTGAVSEVPAVTASTDNADDVFKMLVEEENTLKRTIPVSNAWANPAAGGMGMGMGAPGHYGAHAQQQDRYGNKGGRGAGPGGFGGFNKAPGGGGGSYTCNRCGKTGHIAKFCPTVGDAAFDPEIRLMNVPRTGRKTVTSLEGIDTSMSTVIERTDGSYEVFESSTRGMEKLTREGGLAGNVDMAAVPPHLKCALSNTLLREAVTLPCCSQSVNDSVVRLRLVSSGLVCPICNTPNISPDSLIIRKDLRNEVENYVESLRRADEPPAQPVFSTGFNPGFNPAFNPAYAGGPPTMPQPLPAGFMPPPPAGPPPPQPLLPPPAASLALAGLPPMPTAGSTEQGSSMGQMAPGPGLTGVGGAPLAPAGAPTGLMNNMLLPPNLDEIPPVEALPLPLSKEQFLAEQRLQIILLKELHGGVLPQLSAGQYGGPPAGRGGYNAGGRGWSATGRGFYGGRGSYNPNYVPGGGRGRGGFYQQQPFQDRNERYSSYDQNRDHRDDRYSRHDRPDDARREGTYRKGEEGENGAVRGSSRARSSERDAHKRSDRDDTRDEKRRRRSDSRDRPPVEESTQRGVKRPSSRDLAESAAPTSRGTRDSRERVPAADDVRQDSKRRRHEEEARSENHRGHSKSRDSRVSRDAPREDSHKNSRADESNSHRGRSERRSRDRSQDARLKTTDGASSKKSEGHARERNGERDSRDRQSHRDHSRDARSSRGQEKSSAKEKDNHKDSSRDRPAEKPRGDSRDRGQERSARDSSKPVKEDRPREDRSRDSRSRDVKPREDAKKEDRTEKRSEDKRDERKDKEYSNKGDRRDDRRSDRRDEKPREDRSRGSAKNDERESHREAQPALVLQEKDSRDRTRDKGSSAPASKIVVIPPLKSSRGPSGSLGQSQPQQNQSSGGKGNSSGGGGGGGSSSKRTVIVNNDSKRKY